MAYLILIHPENTVANIDIFPDASARRWAVFGKGVKARSLVFTGHILTKQGHVRWARCNGGTCSAEGPSWHVGLGTEQRNSSATLSSH